MLTAPAFVLVLVANYLFVVSPKSFAVVQRRQSSNLIGVLPDLLGLIRAIAAGDLPRFNKLLTPLLARAAMVEGASRQSAKPFFLDEIGHYVYAGDTALHLAAAGYRVAMVKQLLALDAAVGARNRRGAEPLHYAADGTPGAPTFDPRAQAAVIALLLKAGADANSADDSGVAPLHRAVRTRCAAAVRALLEGGANPRRKNGNGSTPMQLATQTTGRGGSGSPEAKQQQAKIVALLKEVHAQAAPR